MRNLTSALVLASGVTVGVIAAPPIFAQTNQGASGSMMGDGMMSGGMSQCMMHRGMASGMTERDMGRGMMMGSGMMQDSRRSGMTTLFGSRVKPPMNLSVDDVRGYLSLQLKRLDNKRLKIGDVKSDDGAITADIVTVDNSLVQRLKVDRHTGSIDYEN